MSLYSGHQHARPFFFGAGSHTSWWEMPLPHCHSTWFRCEVDLPLAFWGCATSPGFRDEPIPTHLNPATEGQPVHSAGSPGKRLSLVWDCSAASKATRTACGHPCPHAGRPEEADTEGSRPRHRRETRACWPRLAPTSHRAQTRHSFSP